jgi:TetR/AcrR family transcriptional regulator, cholesterol catabolism regulator
MEVRERIITVATELFLKEGVRRITMDQLAVSLGMSKRTIYEFFSNKDMLLKECIENHIKLQRFAVNELVANSETVLHFYLALLQIGIENMKSQNPQFVNDVRIYYPSIWESTICANREYSLEQTSEFIQKGINEGVFRSDINIPIISKLLVEVFTLLANSDIFPYHIYPLATMFEHTLITLTRGLSTKKGVEIIEEYLQKSVNQQLS